jgi:phosphoribosylanthranilate isomerase
VTEVKFCGLTRPEDVHEAARLGVSYIGAIMTESPRRVSPETAQALFSVLAGTSVRRVGVFGDEPVDEIIRKARTAGVDVVQLHGAMGVDAAVPDLLKSELGVELWRVIRVGPDGSSAQWGQTPLSGDSTSKGSDPISGSLEGTDGVLLDTLAQGTLGGTGVRFPWGKVIADVRSLRHATKVILAGGLQPENVREAIDLLAPDVVDVSSGVESQPGIKDHARMAAFIDAVRQTSSAPAQ